MQKFKNFVKAHKIVSTVAVILLAIGAYEAYASANTAVAVTKYVVQDAAQGTIVSSVSATGQVAAVTSIDVKPQTSETVTKIYVQPGDQVTAGQPLAQLDTTNEANALQQAQFSMQSAQLSLAKLEEAPATSTLVGDEDSVTQAEQSVANASTTLQKDYETGFDDLGSTFVDFQTVMSGMGNFVGGDNINRNQSNPDAYLNLMPQYLQAATLPYDQAAQAGYAAAVTAYQQDLAAYQAATRNSSTTTLDALFSQTYDTANTISAAVKSSKDLLSYVVDNYPSASSTSPLPAITTTFETNLGTYTNTIDGDVSSVANTQNTIQSDETSITNAALSLSQDQDSLAELQAGADPLSIQSQQLSIQQQQLSLQTAEQNLADDTIRAPIAGEISAVDAVVGETVASPAFSMVGSGEEAQVTLNEIDAAKVALGDQVTLTFDALPDVSLAGQVIEIDPVGTVTQGVVNYSVNIGFSQPANTSSSDQVKPGMSVTANIVTQADQNVIAVPNAAIVTQGTASYILEPATPVSAADLTASASGGIILPATKEVPVTLGLSNDTQTEITSGVNVGDQIIVQTIKSTTAKATASTGSSALQLLGGAGAARTGAAGGGFGGGGGGFTRGG